MHLRSIPTMEHISVPIRRHPQHSFVVLSSYELHVVAIIL